MSGSIWTVLAAGVVITLTHSVASSSPIEAFAFTKAHAAFVNAIPVDLGPSGNDIRDNVITECASVSLNKLRVYALNEGVRKSIGYLGGNKVSSALIASILGQVAKIDDGASQELRCLAVLTVARRGDPKTWDLVDKLSSAPKRPLGDIEQIIDAHNK